MSKMLVLDQVCKTFNPGSVNEKVVLTDLSLELETGRTHQIRVHMSYTGHPLLGDEVYGGGASPFEHRHRSHICGQCLFAAKLILTHPRTKEKMEFSAPLPDNFEKLLTILRADCE